MVLVFFFFFSSRRRHTRSLRDWSSDVCSSDLLGWDDRLGSIAPGHWADLVVISGKAKEPYLQLVEARETSIALVIIDGVPRLGRPTLMAPFGTPTEQVHVGGVTRALNLTD